MKTLKTLLVLAAAALATTACDGILDVSDPTRVEEDDLASPSGVELLRAKAITELYDAVSYGAYHGGLVADELFYIPSSFSMQSGTVQTATRIDQRLLRDSDALRVATKVYEAWNEVRVASTYAIDWYEEYAGEAQRADVGQLLAAKGYATLALGEQVCSGFPLHEIDGDRPVWSDPLTTDEVFEHALEILDDAVEAAGDDAEHRYLASVARGRALLGLGRFAEAAEAVADVPTDYAFSGEYGAGTDAKTNRMRSTLTATGDTHGIGAQKGGNGIDYVSANDPRLELEHLGAAHEGTEIYVAARYQEQSSPITISSGIEARLIEAEAALDAGDADWLDILNELRATQAPEAMDPLTDPGTEEARVDLLFRERALWLYGTGHRLGDLRRLVDRYGRAAEDVFPTGAYPLGGVYESATSLPFSIEGEDWAGTGVVGCVD